MKLFFGPTCFLSLVWIGYVKSFGILVNVNQRGNRWIPTTTRSHSFKKIDSTKRFRYIITTKSSSPILFAAKKDNGGDGNNDELSKGMEDAFRQLEELNSFGDDSFTVPERKVKQDEAFAKAMQELDLKEIQQQTGPAPTPEAEAALYSDMAKEISGTSEMDIIDDLKSDLGSDSKTSIPRFDPESRESEKFMEKAFDEALEEAKAKGGEESIVVDKESILDNKEIMKEIEAIFDKANEQLLEGLEEIRAEQIELSKASAQRNSKESEEKIKEDEERLAAAEANMKKMLQKVNDETKNVEAAIEDLKRAQEEMGGGVDGQLLDLKSGGIIKQATLVGSLLFSFRSLVDGIAFLEGDTSHLVPAIAQGGIALVCVALLVFRK